MAEYYVLLTNAGAARLINAELTGGLVQISQVAVGDGNGAAIVPSETMTALVNEVWRGPVNDVHQHATEANWLVVECVIPEEIGGWTVREIGVFDSNGDLIAIGNLPETYKPVLAEGSGKDLYLRVNLQVGNASVVNLAVDPAIVLATRSYVDDSLAAHALSTNHPDATTEAKGLVELATGSETDLGADSSRALTPLGLANAQRAGQCRLVLDGANLRLIPVDGNKLTVNGIARTIPAAGIALAPTGLSPNTTYYIYAAMVADVLTLVASTTGHAADSATGMEVKTDDPSHSLVGMAYPLAGPAFVDSEHQRFVSSWFNRQPKRLSIALSFGGDITSTSPIPLTGLDLEFAVWEGAASTSVGVSFHGINDYGGAVLPYLDGAALGPEARIRVNPSQVVTAHVAAAAAWGEGKHTLSVYVNTNATQIIGMNGGHAIMTIWM